MRVFLLSASWHLLQHVWNVTCHHDSFTFLAKIIQHWLICALVGVLLPHLAYTPTSRTRAHLRKLTEFASNCFVAGVPHPQHSQISKNSKDGQEEKSSGRSRGEGFKKVNLAGGENSPVGKASQAEITGSLMAQTGVTWRESSVYLHCAYMTCMCVFL